MMAGPPLKALAFWVAQEAFVLFVSLSISSSFTGLKACDKYNVSLAYCE
jgi:hypothetical protein